MGEVQEGRGLVQQQHRRALSQRHSDPHPLALTAGELVDGAVGQLGGPGGQQRLLNDPAVLGARGAEHGLVRVAPASHEVGHRDPLGGDRLLGQQAQPGRQSPGGDLADGGLVEQDLARSRCQDPGHGLEQRRLPAGVGPHDDGDSAAGDCHVHTVDDDVPTVSGTQAPCGELGDRGGGGGRRGGHAEAPCLLMRMSWLMR